MANHNNSIDPQLAQAISNHQAGSLEEAERLYRAVLSRKPTDTVALTNLGILLAKAERLEEASAQLREAVRLDPRAFQPNLLCANTLLMLGRAGEAVPMYRRCLASEPRNLTVLINLGLALHQSGNYDEAIKCYRTATEINPKSAAAWFNLGDSCVGSGDYSEAVSAIETGLGISSEDAMGWTILAEARTGMGDLIGALEAVGRAIELNPLETRSVYVKACALQLLGETELAAVQYREVIDRDPEHISARFNLGIVLGDQGRTDAARAEFAWVSDHDKGSFADAARIRRAILAPVVADSVAEIAQVRARMVVELLELRSRHLRVEDPQMQIGNPTFFLAYQGGNNRELVEEIADVLIEACPDLVWTAPHCHRRSKRTDKVRIAFISGHLREHTVGRITEGLIEHLDRAKFEAIVMRPAGSSDTYSAEIDEKADLVVDLPTDFRKAREVVASYKLDAIYYPDIGMEPFTYCLAFSRLAQLQAVGWGHANSTGIPNADVFLSSAQFELPDSQDQYSEELVCMPQINCFYPKLPPDFEVLSRSELDLPEDAKIYLCPQSVFKLHPDFDEALAEILRLDPQALIGLSEGKEPHWNELLISRFKRTIPEGFDRIRLIPRVAPEQFRGLLKMADVVIDPKHFTGGHTSYMAFGTGVPVVTWNGDRMSGRMTSGLYRQIGMKGPIANDAKEFAELAVRVANDMDFANALRDELRAKSERLFEDMEAVRGFEKAILGALKAV